MADLILHHYDQSPYAEKIRLVLGLKGLAWKSVEIPVIMPKPDLMPLTGGYRRTPVLQVGADIYCDTELIAREIERRHPKPTLYPEGGSGLAAIIGNWVATSFFMPSVRYPMGRSPGNLPPEFYKDRAAMRGLDISAEKMVAGIQAVAPRMKHRLQVQCEWLESILGDGRPYLLGANAGLADASVYHCVWFVRRAGAAVSEALTPFPRVLAWMARMDQIGHGKPTAITAADALDIAQRATPETQTHADPADAEGFKPGDSVSMTSEDTGRDPVTGTIVAISTNHVALRRQHPRVGEVVVHFPRMGYDLRLAAG